jgi:UDPglucose 6-dehydrogenase
MFASVGNHVTCVDKDSNIVDTLRNGKCTIHEPGLKEILRSAIADGTLHFTTDTAAAVENADAAFIAVGTPSLESGAYDFQYVEDAAREIGRALCGDKRYFVVLKSAVTPDIYTRVQEILEKETAALGAEFEVLSNPEFLAEGTAIRDFAQPHRVIAGLVSQEAPEFMEGLYSPFTKRKVGLLQFTDPTSAIVTKLAANSFLACRVALDQRTGPLLRCDAVGADIECVRTGLASDPRIGQQFLYAGPGYG